MGFESIPDELKRLAQWVVWRNEDGIKHPYNVHTSHYASVSNPNTWATFDACANACSEANRYYDGVGFVLTESDPYAFIDLDATTDIESVQLQTQIFNSFDSYAELSPSGKGLHIIVRGKVECGRRRYKTEIYSSHRYMTVTGNVYRNRPIVDCRHMLQSLWEYLANPKLKSDFKTELEYQAGVEALYTDDEIHATACNAANGDKYQTLFNGLWQGLYESQSEADFALINIIAYYTQNIDQIVRLFYRSALGRRPKAKRKDYLSWMLNRAFDRMPPPVDFDSIVNKTVELVAKTRAAQIKAEDAMYEAQRAAFEREKEEAKAKRIAARVEQAELDRRKAIQAAGCWVDLPTYQGGIVEPSELGQVNGHVYRGDLTFPSGRLISVSDIISHYDYANQPVLYTNPAYQFPEGLIGEIADYIYKTSPRPIAEISLMASLALMAGIVGRSYTISNTGLNIYGVILAKTGNGKEALSSGISRLMSAVCTLVPAASEFSGFGDAASSQGFLRFLANSNTKSFLTISKEFGQYLDMGRRSGGNPTMQGIFRSMLDLFNLSGPGQVLRSSTYSDKERNTADIHSPAVTFIGESTPSKFYGSVTEDFVSDGLIPRFLVFDYKGKKPALNESPIVQPNETLIHTLATIAANSLQLSRGGNRIDVRYEQDAYKLMKAFGEWIDQKQNVEDLRELELDLWSRAQFKALRLAALVAVGCNFIAPVITESMAVWAINVASADAHNMQTRFSSGDVGSVENEEAKQVAYLKTAIKRWIMNPWGDVASNAPGPYGAKLHQAKIVPYAYLNNKLHNLGAFKKDKLGASKALKRALEIMCDNGDLSLVNKIEMQRKHGTGQTGYAVENARILE